MCCSLNDCHEKALWKEEPERLVSSSAWCLGAEGSTRAPQTWGHVSEPLSQRAKAGACVTATEAQWGAANIGGGQRMWWAIRVSQDTPHLLLHTAVFGIRLQASTQVLSGALTPPTYLLLALSTLSLCDWWPDDICTCLSAVHPSISLSLCSATSPSAGSLVGGFLLRLLFVLRHALLIHVLTRSCQFIRLFVSVSPFISPPASLRLTFSQCICLPTPSVCQYAPTLTRSGPVQARWEVLCAGGCVLVLACACACVCARTCLKKTKLSTHATCLSPFIIRVGVLALVFLSTFISRETIEILQSLIWFSSVLKMLLECKYITHTHKSKEKENNSEELTTSGQPDQAGFVLRHHIFKVSGFHREEIKTGLPASNWKVKYTDNFPYHISELHTSFCCRATQSKICYYSLLEEKKKLY